ncbi:hypothetical protein D9M72_604160 [compost metagenome]
MTQKASQKKVPLPASQPRTGGVSHRPRTDKPTLEVLLKRFDPQLHYGEVMAWPPVGAEVPP